MIIGTKTNENTLSTSLIWVWEFSKKVVLICFIVYVCEQIYSAIAMWYFADFSYLGIMLEQSSDILKTCVFGYLVKAGVENTLKIATTAKQSTEANEHTHKG